MSDAPRVRCSLRLEFPSKEIAEKIHSSVSLDNEGYLQARLDGNVIIAEIEAQSLNSLLHTLDDFLTCTGVAERVITKKT